MINKQPNIRHASGGPLYRWSFASAAVVPDQEARWLQEKFNLRLKAGILISCNLQAASLTRELG